jgi:hypothetical protein
LWVEAADGVHSPLERNYVHGVERAHGRAAHPAESRWRDTHRDNANLLHDTQTLRYGWPDTTMHRCRTAAEVAGVLRRHGWTGTLRACRPGCAAPGLLALR